MALITYEDKDNSLPTSNVRRLFRDVDANEIKSVVNENANNVYSGPFPQVTASGTDTYTATLSPAITAYALGQKFQVLFTNGNGGAATMAFNGLAALAITKNGATALAAGDIAAGSIKILAYDGTRLQIVGDGAGTGSVVSVTGENNAVDNTDTANPIVRNGSRTITGASASVIGDNLGKVIFNSGVAFNFTIDQLAANTTITCINYGAADVTLVAGAGMTLTGTTTIPGASDPVFPSCVIIYDTLTTAHIIVGGDNVSILARSTVSISAGTLTLDFINRELRNFILDTAASSGFTIALDNAADAQAFDLVLLITGSVAVTMPSTFRMMEVEEDAGRWNTGTRVLTLTGTTGSIFRLTGSLSDAVWLVDVSVPYV